MNKSHGMVYTRTYSSWADMIKRCNNPNATAYKNYGGRGIKVDSSWKLFVNFLADMGEVPTGMQLERIDNDKDYNKDNCKWATIIEQANNKRNNRIIIFAGLRMTIKQWARFLGINKTRMFSGRISQGWHFVDASTRPYFNHRSRDRARKAAINDDYDA